MPKKQKAARQKQKTSAKKGTISKKKVSASAKKIVKGTAVKKVMTKTELFNAIAEETGSSKKEVKMFFESFTNQIERQITPRAVGECTIPGLMKIKTVRKPATKEREGINPFTKEKTIFKAKPARTIVKIKALSGLKGMVQG